MTRTTFEIIVEAMLGGSASLDAERYSRALTDNFDTIPMAHHLRHVFDSGLDALSASPSGDAVARFFASGYSPDRRVQALYSVLAT